MLKTSAPSNHPKKSALPAPASAQHRSNYRFLRKRGELRTASPALFYRFAAQRARF
jgi:hypothetical protein